MNLSLPRYRLGGQDTLGSLKGELIICAHLKAPTPQFPRAQEAFWISGEASVKLALTLKPQRETHFCEGVFS